MSMLKGPLTVRRYRVVGRVPDDFRERYAEALRFRAFRESANPAPGEVRVGWVEIQNLLDTGFEDVNRWLQDRYLLCALRVDKKVLPAKLFRAHLEKREQAWCAQNARTRCPAAVRAELKEQLEFEMLARTLPRVQVYEVCWNVTDGWLLFHHHSDTVNEAFRKLFFETFGLKALAETPLDLLLPGAPELAEALLASVGTDYRPEVVS